VHWESGRPEDLLLSAAQSRVSPRRVRRLPHLTTRIDKSWAPYLANTGPRISFAFDGAFRAFGWVLEGEGAWHGTLDSFLCPRGAVHLRPRLQVHPRMTAGFC